MKFSLPPNMYPVAPEIDHLYMSPVPSAPPEPSSPVSMDVSFRNGSHPAHTATCAINPENPLLRASHNKFSTHSLVPWSTNLCDCCDNISSCCLTCWCPCVTFGRIAEIVDKGSTSCGISGALYMMIMCFCGCSCIYSCFYRSKLRGQYFLEERPCTDCCVHCCCEPCALSQEYRQLKNHGFDMSIGWHGNIERWSQHPSAPPFVAPQMKR